MHQIAFEQSKREALTAQSAIRQQFFILICAGTRWQKSTVKVLFTKEEIIRKSLDISNEDYQIIFRAKDECQSRPKYEQRMQLIKLEEIYRDDSFIRDWSLCCSGFTGAIQQKNNTSLKPYCGEKESFS